MSKLKILKLAFIPIVFVTCLLSGFYFAFRVIGYEVMAVVFWGIDLTICAFWGISRLSKKNKKSAKVLKRALILILLVGFVYFSVLEAMAISNSNTDAPAGVDYIIILGAGVAGKEPTVALWNRLTAANDYLKNNPCTKVVCSGGQGPNEEITEAECMYIWLTDQGISHERIIKEDKSKNTNQNISNSIKLINSDKKTKEASVALVSNEFHIFRAKLTAKLYGVSKPYGIAAKSSLPELMINGYIREAFSLTKLWVTGA